MSRFVGAVAAGLGHALRWLIRIVALLAGPAMIVWGIAEIHVPSARIAAGVFMILLLMRPERETK